ncbi:hypothetical protein ACMGE5_10220 [Macrococcus equi]|uniref:hypothetical protein n=1 Tax=Macrococcus equi TaxID=3395462 RepID=UPI0039BE81D2
MDNNEMNMELELLKLKINALCEQAYDHLSDLETTLEIEWMKHHLVTKQYLIEQQRKAYINATIISDIEKDVERIFEDLKQENADTSQINTLASDEVPAHMND